MADDIANKLVRLMETKGWNMVSFERAGLGANLEAARQAVLKDPRLRLALLKSSDRKSILPGAAIVPPLDPEEPEASRAEVWGDRVGYWIGRGLVFFVAIAAATIICGGLWLLGVTMTTLMSGEKPGSGFGWFMAGMLWALLVQIAADNRK